MAWDYNRMLKTASSFTLTPPEKNLSLAPLMSPPSIQESALSTNPVDPSTQSLWAGVTRYQWLVLFVAWLGWVFDAMDATIYAIVLHPALEELLGLMHRSNAGSQEMIGWYGGIIFSIFLIGWAIGGIAFGMVADYFGRTKTLIATILIYALFTGLAALSQNWWHLALYRF